VLTSPETVFKLFLWICQEYCHDWNEQCTFRLTYWNVSPNKQVSS